MYRKQERNNKHEIRAHATSTRSARTPDSARALALHQYAHAQHAVRNARRGWAHTHTKRIGVAPRRKRLAGTVINRATK